MFGKNSFMLVMLLGSILGHPVLAKTQAGTCHGKIKDGDDVSCKLLDSLPDTTWFYIEIIIDQDTATSLETLYSPEYLAKLRIYSDSLYSKYDIHYYMLPYSRLPPPEDSELQWDIAPIRVRASEIIRMVSEDFITEIGVSYVGYVSSLYGTPHPGKAGGERTSSRYYDLNGRAIQRNSPGFHLRIPGLLKE